MKRTLRCALSAFVLAGTALAGSALPALAWPEGLPTPEQYPLRDRLFGSGGAFFPNYSMPSEYGLGFVIASGPSLNGGVVKGSARAGLPVFATGTVDFNCQAEERPKITVLSAPAGGKVVVTPGMFVAAGTDAGSTKCLGQPVSGAVVRYVGRAPQGGTIALRVTYPHLGAWYDHVVPVPAGL
ncbi:hypothetical protein GCM10007301_34960 [Azorhizobium oxalatiphilum]|uniref:Uncharacterized protein n=1 Tax=Azorhizobium oxalatiphilum TaxID=980631 RepID=A0A917FEN5_9HYPH|nr:hypothetical protein [Azorhizobium oxalatiphilum]GGF72182.1 hypothetical protein GCM10007301_34960 [Azorhizobium oxalatiphilum]